jgi:hypothetical protein
MLAARLYRHNFFLLVFTGLCIYFHKKNRAMTAERVIFMDQGIVIVENVPGRIISLNFEKGGNHHNLSAVAAGNC